MDHKGVELFGGGNFSILIHTGQTVNYENDGILEETLVHEAAHTSLDAEHAASAGWLEAQDLDGGFISDYAEEFPDREDIAESFLLWLAVRYREDQISTQDYNLITETIPNRLAYFDNIVCDLFPFQTGNPTAIEELMEANQLIIYPNPTTDIVQLEFEGRDISNALLYNSLGVLVLDASLDINSSIDLSSLADGVYWLVVDMEDHRTRKKIIKQ